MMRGGLLDEMHEEERLGKWKSGEASLGGSWKGWLQEVGTIEGSDQPTLDLLCSHAPAHHQIGRV